jgi:subtilisin family serine protease
MKEFNFPVRYCVIILCTLVLSFSTPCLYAQEPVFQYFYRIYLKDKGTNINGKYSAYDLLSSRAVNRRQKAGIQAPDFRDLPVYKSYLDQISYLGLKLHTTSKWMNTALFKSQSAFDIKILLDLPFVSDVKIVKTTGSKSKFNDKLNFIVEQADIPSYDRPVSMVNGQPMLDSGYDGRNVLIAILDGGFRNADNISSLSGLRLRNGIKKTYDFVNKTDSVYNSSSHGTAVLSVIAGNLPGQIEGTAPGADFLLLKTEDVNSEFPCEEDYWVAGAEFADSSGADIISSSLGYFNFDDPALNYKYSDLDGKTAFITIAAELAASKGILVVNSAGNERTVEWKRIIFPSDGDSVLAVGAVDGNKIISDFSSAGPSADGRIKPDNVAMGVSVPVQSSENSTGRASGTSFSCPVLSGMAACLLQAVPKALISDIINALHSSADRYNYPDSLYGYGIPNIVLVLARLQNKYIRIPDNRSIVSPNPTTGDIEIIFSSPAQKVTVEIISITGKLIFRRDFADYAGRTIILTDLRNREQGVYLLRVIYDGKTDVHKIIKLTYRS